jgi:hypothetical protein
MQVIEVSKNPLVRRLQLPADMRKNKAATQGKKQLTVTKEKVRNLGRDGLKAVAGGMEAQSCDHHSYTTKPDTI